MYKFFKPQPVLVQTVNGIQVAKATGRTAQGIFAVIDRKSFFVPERNIVEWV